MKLHRAMIRGLPLPAILAAALLCPALSFAAPGDVLFSENFNDGSLTPWTSSNVGRSGILSGAQVAASGSAAFTRNNPVTLTSPGFSASVPAARLDIWIRRGSDAFSEDTDNGEDFYIEYRRADNSWGLLASYLGSGTNGQIYTDSFVLPADALHGNLAIRARQIAGSGFDFDYWHFDDVVVTELAPAGTLDVGTCDDFESGLNNWNLVETSGLAGISNVTSSSPGNSLFLNGGVVTVTSNVIDTSDVSFTDLTLWVRRGSRTFSEDPDNGENLVVEYLDDSNNWVAIETFTGAGGPGQIFNRTYDLPTAGRHSNFRLRFRMLAGSGTIWDFWHIDDVCFDQVFVPQLMVTKLAQTLSDPFNGGSNPKSIPGAIVQYTINVSNQGLGAIDANSLVIREPVPPDTALFVDTGTGDPITLTNGPTPTGLSFNFATDVAFSNQTGGGAPFNYTPVPDGDGFDPAVTGYEITPGGVLNGASGTSTPSFDVRFRVRIQ